MSPVLKSEECKEIDGIMHTLEMNYILLPDAKTVRDEVERIYFEFKTQSLRRAFGLIIIERELRSDGYLEKKPQYICTNAAEEGLVCEDA